jgi:hypothetical protein
MNLMQKLATLQEQVARQAGQKVDCYYMEGYGALFVPHGYPLHPNYIMLAFPDIAIRMNP